MFAIWLGLFLFSTVNTASNRIINGTDAEPGEIPYIVSLRYRSGHSCGASILNQNWILTAAHCVIWWSQSDFSVQYGVTRTSSDGINTVSVERIITHPNFSFLNGLTNDVAVVKLTEPLVFSQFVKPVVLPAAFNSTPAGAEGVLAGWGLSYPGGDMMHDLQKVNLQVFSDEECENIHATTGPSSRLYHLCAGVVGGGKGQCNGDSGSPLVVNGIQVGIVSWSVKPCTIAPYPGVFAKVSNYVKWIYDNVALQ